VEKEQCEAILSRLDVLISLTVSNHRDSIDPNELIVKMRQLGLSPQEVASLLDITPNAVNVAFHRGRKKGKPRETGMSRTAKEGGRKK
jgi:hypothetical protein